MDLELILFDYVVPVGVKLVVAILAFFIGRLLIRWAISIEKKVFEKFNVAPILSEFISSVSKALLYVLLILGILGYLGFDTTSVVALLAAAGLAVGLALKDSLNNFASGVMLILTQPFKVGDFVEVAGQAGIAEKITLFNTVMRSTDNREIIIPNGQIYADKLVNYSARPTRRIDMVFGIGYDSDLRLAKQVLLELIAAEERAHKDPEPLVAVAELADSSVNIAVRIWTDSADYWPVRFDFIEQVKLAFDAQGIVIPYPQMDLHLQAPAGAELKPDAVK